MRAFGDSHMSADALLTDDVPNHPSTMQVTYNLKNSLLWLGLFKYFSPTGTANIFMLADFFFIAPVAFIYVTAFLDETGKGML